MDESERKDRVEVNGTPVDVRHGPNTVTVSTGSYTRGHAGMKLVLHLDYVAELVQADQQRDLEALFQVASDRAIQRVNADE